jgi:SAM-dependent methyltransferase
MSQSDIGRECSFVTFPFDHEERRYAMDATVILPQIDEVRLDEGLFPRRAADDLGDLPMMDAYLSMMRASALATAGRIGLFEGLADGPVEPSELAEKLAVNTVGVQRITDFLIATGHLLRQGNMIANAPETMRWFTRHATVDYGAGLTWTADAWTIMDGLSEAVRRGSPVRLIWDRMIDEPHLGSHFSRYMRVFAEHLSPDLLAAVAVPSGAKRLLDLGGSHATHSMAFCKRYPDLRAVVVDLASALDGTCRRIEAQGLSDRIEVRAGDIRSCDWGEDYDVVLYLSVAHNMSLEENREIARRIARVLRPGGILVIHEYPRETTPAIFESAFRLTLLAETGTRTFSLVELGDMLDDAGFSAHAHSVLSPAEKGTLIIARR